MSRCTLYYALFIKENKFVFYFRYCSNCGYVIPIDNEGFFSLGKFPVKYN